MLHRLPEFPLTVRTAHGRLSVSNKDHGVGRILLYIEREYEQRTLARAIEVATRLGHLPGPGPGWLLDVGANVGTVCIPLVRDGIFAAAVAFEPESRNYRYLVRNVHANGLAASIRTVNCALSSISGVASLELSPGNSGDHRVRVAPPVVGEDRYRETRRRVIEVPVRTLDEALSAIPLAPADVRLLWMDVQGHEIHVLAGARGLLATGIPVVAEFWPYGLIRAGVTPAALSAFVTSAFEVFYDLGEVAPQARPTAAIAGLFDLYRDVKAFTDLLLLPARTGR